jgi:molybdate transport system permease protein
MQISGAEKERLFNIAIASTLVVLGLFFGVLLLSMIGSTTPGKFWSLVRSKEILFAIRLSVITATVATALAMLLAVPTAYVLSRRNFRGKNFVDTILDLPIVISPVALGAALMVFSNTQLGRAIEGGLFQFVFEVPGIILAQFTVISALAVRLLKSTFDGIDPRYEGVGRVLGCTKWRAFHRIVLPLARPGLIAAIILTWARAIGEYGASVTLAGATAMKTETLPIAIFLSFSTADVEKAIAIVLILVVIASAALLLVRWLSGRSLRV